MNRVHDISCKQLSNRSSKHLILLQGWKPAVRSLSNAKLSARISANPRDWEASREMNRRVKNGGGISIEQPKKADSSKQK